MVTKPLFPQSGEILNDVSTIHNITARDISTLLYLIFRIPYGKTLFQSMDRQTDRQRTTNIRSNSKFSELIIQALARTMILKVILDPLFLRKRTSNMIRWRFLRARQNSPLTSPSGSSHLDFSPTSSSSNRSRFHATPHPSRSSTTFIPGSLTKVSERHLQSRLGSPPRSRSGRPTSPPRWTCWSHVQAHVTHTEFLSPRSFRRPA